MEGRKNRFGKISQGLLNMGFPIPIVLPKLLLQHARKSHFYTDPGTKALEVSDSQEQPWAVPNPVRGLLPGPEPRLPCPAPRLTAAGTGCESPSARGARSVWPTEPRAAGTVRGTSECHPYPDRQAGPHRECSSTGTAQKRREKRAALPPGPHDPRGLPGELC